MNTGAWRRTIGSWAHKLTDAARKPGGRSIEGDASPAATLVIEDHLQRLAQASEGVGHRMAVAETIERLVLLQERMTLEIRSAKTVSRDASSRQRAIADQIAAVERLQQESASTTAPTQAPDAVNWRVRAMEGLLSAQDELAVMQQQFALAQETDGARRKTTEPRRRRQARSGRCCTTTAAASQPRRRFGRSGSPRCRR